MTEADIRYPTGRWQRPERLDPPTLAAAIEAIAALPREIAAALEGAADAVLDRPYREGGWSPRQIAHHVADSHLNAYCRHRLALTEERPTIRPYDQEAWARLADAASAPVAPSLAILTGVHERWTRLLRSLEPRDFEREFVHPDRPGSPWTLGESVSMYAWHGRHHTAQIAGARASKG